VERYALTRSCGLVLQLGDITRAEVDAIVNAANEWMLGGGGVDGAIHAAAGPELVEACRRVPEARKGVRCPTGEARITPGFRLPARYVIHTAGPVYDSVATSGPLLRACHLACLWMANEQRLATIAFPAISCGIYGYPLDEAAPIAIHACREGAGSLREVRFVLFTGDAFDAWRLAADAILSA